MRFALFAVGAAQHGARLVSSIKSRGGYQLSRNKGRSGCKGSLEHGRPNLESNDADLGWRSHYEVVKSSRA